MSLSAASSSSHCSTISNISTLAERVDNLSFDISNYIPKSSHRNSRVIHSFKPTATQGIYAKLVLRKMEVEHVVQRLIQSIETDFNKIHELLQIIPDLLLINYEIEDYSSQEYDEQIGVRLKMAAERQLNIQKCNIVLTHGSNFGKDISLIIDLFLWHLIKQLTSERQKLPAFEKIMRVFISFLRHLDQSELDALRVTAHLFAFRLNQYLCVRKIQIASNCIVDLDTSAILYDAINEVINKYQLDAIYTGVQHNIHFQTLYDEYARCNRVFVFADDGKQFTNDRCISFMTDLLELKQQKMVQHVIQSCIVLMQQRHLDYVFESEAFAKMVKQLYRRMNHVNDDIAMLAATFFSVAFQYRHFALPDAHSIIDRLIIRSYSEKLKLARQFGEAVAYYLKQYETETILEMFIKFANNYDECTYNRLTAIKYSYLLETLYPHLYVLEPLQIMSLIIKPPHTEEHLCAMMEILYHSCCMHYKGKILMERIREGVSAPSDIFTLTRYLLLNYSKLIKRTKTSYEGIQWVFKALALPKYSSSDLFQLKDMLTKVVKESLELFYEQRIIEQIWYSVAAFIEAASHMQGGAEYLFSLEIVVSKIVEEYQQRMTQLVGLRDDEAYEEMAALQKVKIEIICALTKIKTILMCNVSVMDVDFVLFYEFWADSDLPDEIVREQITICAHHIKCQVQEVVKNERAGNADFLPRLISEVRSFWLAMDHLYARKPRFFGTIYEAMGILISNYGLLFAPALRDKLEFSAGAFNYSESWRTADEMFSTFWEECVLKSGDAATLPLATRRKYFAITFQLYYRPGHPNAYTAYIIKLIASYPKCKALHKTSYKNFFNQLALHSKDFVYLIVATLDFIDENEEEWQDEEVVELCGLLSGFLLSKEKLSLLKCFIDFAAEKNKYMVLKHIKLFEGDLSTYEKRKFNDHARSILPTEHTLIL